MWDERYSQPGYAYGTDPNDFLVQVVDQIPPGPVLCLAEGQGRNGVFLASRGFEVTGVDASAVGLATARALAEERGVALRTVVADLAEFTIEPDAWSGIVSIFCHLPPELRRAVNAAVVSGLRPGGVFVLESYTPDQLRHGTGGPPVRELLVTLDDLRVELAGLDFEIAREIEREVREGRFHTGPSAVVQVLARKLAP